MLVRMFLDKFGSLLLAFLGMATGVQAADDFASLVRPVIAEHCAGCHDNAEVKGKVNLQGILTKEQLLGQPGLIQEMIEVLDAHDMPPDGEPELAEASREKLIVTLKSLLRESASAAVARPVQMRRLNRFQYNNSVRDLFQLKLDIFELPEKLMTRHDNYLPSPNGKMPDRVEVASHSLNPMPGLRDVIAFPKDLRASHGFDNQADQLTLSPLLLETFLRLSVSILESPDFNEANVGCWKDFFQEPAAGKELQAEVRRRLEPFLKLAFRSSVDGETVDRYTAYVLAKKNQGLSFTDSMKKVSSAILSSPRFLYRSESTDPQDGPFELASRLSFFLWGSIPDRELLQQAETGEISQPDVLNQTMQRMFADPKIERFLDSFPTQWMQLENVLAAKPDPETHPVFSLDENNPASLQMVIEPLLLFDAVFIEDRPITDLLQPGFSYQSEFLKAWYTTELRPTPMDARKIEEENRGYDEVRRGLDKLLKTTRAEREELLKPITAQILAARKKDTAAKEPVDLKPYAAWEFNGDLKDSLGALDLKAQGQIEFQDGMVVLKEAFLQSPKLPIELKAKSMEVWFKLHDLNQSGGGVMGTQGPGDFFDTIVLGERKPQHWISGSNGFSRTEDFADSTPEEKPDQMLHLVMVYAEDGTTTLYRYGKPYGQPFRKGAAKFPKDNTSILFGLRHLPPGGNRYLTISVDKARLYNRALTAVEVALSASGDDLYVSDQDLTAALTPEQKSQIEAWTKSIEQLEAALKQVPQSGDPGKVQQKAQQRFADEMRKKLRSRRFDRGPATDPRYGGVITNAAMLSMTSGTHRTHPIARGAWIIEVIFNDPPKPPPNDIPALNEEPDTAKWTIREKFAMHRENSVCAGCHARLDPLGFAMENFDTTGRWRDKYENGRDVDASGTLMKKYKFDGVVQFKESLVTEKRRFAKAFTRHLLRFALAEELSHSDLLVIDEIVDKAEHHDFKLKTLVTEVIRSDRFMGAILGTNL